MTDCTMLSRSGRTDPSGKLTARLDIPVSEETVEGVITLANIAGMSKAEWVRATIERAVFGELHMLRRMHRTGPQCPSDESTGAA